MSTKGPSSIARFGVAAAILLLTAGVGIGQLLVKSDPAGALVTIDGRQYDTTPLTVTNLAAGEHLFTLQLTDHEDVQRTVRVDPSRRASVEIKLPPVMGLVLIHSTPPGAEVEIKGAHRGVTPLLLTDLPVGRYRVKLTTAGFAPREVDLAVENRTPRRIHVNLTSDSAQLSIQSEPAGAAVTVNGGSQGTTPCSLDRLAAGRVAVELSLAGYQTYRQELLLEAGTSNAIQAALVALPASLSIVSTPPRARIFVNDQFRGEAPLTLTNVAPGSCTVRAELRGHEPATKSCDLQRAGSASLDFALVRNSGILEIVTEPAGVRVFIDGEDCGLTPDGETDVVSNPLRVELLSKGAHRLQLTRKGFETVDKTFEVEMDKTVTLSETLRKKFIADKRVRFRTEAGGEEVKFGAVSQRYPNGDIELEVRPGIFTKILGSQIIAIEPVRSSPKE